VDNQVIIGGHSHTPMGLQVAPPDASRPPRGDRLAVEQAGDQATD
jgi:hypothetical protein